MNERTNEYGLTPEQAAEHERLKRISPALAEFVVFGLDFEGNEVKRIVVGDVAAAMRGERVEPAMLIPGWLVRGVLHWVYSDAEAGKTWLALKWAVEVMRAGGVVLWVDEELGEPVIADRLLALGATPDEVDTRLVYLPFPSWTDAPVDTYSWDLLLRIVKPSMVVFDTATDALTAAGLDEDRGTDVTTWVKVYPEKATARGVATVVLDHTDKKSGLAPGKHAVGSRAKRAKAKVQYSLRSEAPFGPSRMGRVRVALTKNTLGAEIPPEDRMYDVGGDDAGNFVWMESMFGAILATGQRQGSPHDLHHRIVALLKEEGRPMLTTTIRDRVRPAGNEATKNVLGELANGPWPVKARTPASGKGTEYLYVEPEAEAATPTSVVKPAKAKRASSSPKRRTSKSVADVPKRPKRTPAKRTSSAKPQTTSKRTATTKGSRS